jgi:predicted nucleotidyltransferase
VERALRRWIDAEASQHPGLRRLGYFGSYARGDWGVGSDLDLVAIVDRADLPFHERGREWALETLPVPAEILVYTEDEWERLHAAGGRFAQMLAKETIWIYPPREVPTA